MYVYVYVYVCGIGCFFFWHINLSEYCVKTLPSVDIERGFVSHSGAVGAGVVFLCVGLKSLGMPKFETYEFERFYSIYLAGEGLAPFFVDGLDCFC